MRFITLFLLALLPVTAMAGDRVTSRDISDLYEYVDDSMAGNSCKAEAKDGTDKCSITCVSWENAICTSTRTTATCLCLPASRPPKDVEAVK